MTFLEEGSQEVILIPSIFSPPETEMKLGVVLSWLVICKLGLRINIYSSFEKPFIVALRDRRKFC